MSYDGIGREGMEGVSKLCGSESIGIVSTTGALSHFTLCAAFGCGMEVAEAVKTSTSADIAAQCSC